MIVWAQAWNAMLHLGQVLIFTQAITEKSWHWHLPKYFRAHTPPTELNMRIHAWLSQNFQISSRITVGRKNSLPHSRTSLPLPMLLLVSDEWTQQDSLCYFIVFHKLLKTLCFEGKFSSNASGSPQGAGFISSVETPMKIPVQSPRLIQMLPAQHHQQSCS